MAKTATKSAKKTVAKPAAAKGSGGKSGAGKTGSGKRSRSDEGGSTAADALLKLLQSPLVADLLAVGATAAVAALTEHRYSSRSGTGAGAKKALKGAVTAAAAAMGRRIATEFDEVKKAAKAKSASAS